MTPLVTEVRELETCLDSSRMCELILDVPADTALVDRLRMVTQLQYFPHFPRPLFRADRPRAYVVQGVIGSTTLRVTFSPQADDAVEESLKSCIEGRIDG